MEMQGDNATLYFVLKLSIVQKCAKQYRGFPDILRIKDEGGRIFYAACRTPLRSAIAEAMISSLTPYFFKFSTPIKVPYAARLILAPSFASFSSMRS